MTYTAQQIEQSLDDLLAAVLSSRRTSEEIAKGVTPLDLETQQFVLHWTEVISKSNSEMAYQFVRHAPRALHKLGLPGTRQWLLHAMDIYDQQGLYPGSNAFARIPEFARELHLRQIAVPLPEVRTILERFLCGLQGINSNNPNPKTPSTPEFTRELQIKPHTHTHTDTETLFLPERIESLPTREQNRALYKATAAHLWAQIYFGTYRRPTPRAPHLAERITRFPVPERALKIFYALETIRLHACIARTLPGLAREMTAVDNTPLFHLPPAKSLPHLLNQLPYLLNHLHQPQASVADTLVATTALYHAAAQLPLPPLRTYHAQPTLEDLQTARETAETRLQTEKAQLQLHLKTLARAAQQTRPNAPPKKPQPKKALKNPNPTQPPETPATAPPNQTREHASVSRQIKVAIGKNGEPIRLQLPGSPADADSITAPPQLAAILASMLQDLTELPPEWLVAAGEGGYPSAPPTQAPHPDHHPAPTTASPPSQTPVHHYPEWDFRRRTYRKNWCQLREHQPAPLYDDFATQTLRKYAPLIGELRRHFEALRGHDKLLKSQPNGDNIDLDALITAHADARAGRELSERIFIKRNKIERDLAALFMVDISGSTKGWINDAERESLLLLCEALEILGDQYAIYGFSGMTRNRCEIFRIKTFAEPYTADTRARISGLRPQDYTRMGVAIRHLSKILNQADARTRLLITLSDGKPDDYDGYRGEYGIEDTRQALLEARQTGIHPFCITIDREARDYLPRMVGHVNYAVVDEVRKLPRKVADIYRTLTT